MRESTQGVGPFGWGRDALTIILVVVALLAITFCDNVLLPGVSLTILYVIPVLLAALRTSPRVVFGVAAGSLVLDALESVRSGDIYHTWPIRTAALIVVYGFAVYIASQRKKLANRSRELEDANARANAILANAGNAIFFVEDGSDQLTANWAARRLLAGGSGSEFRVDAVMQRFSRPDGSLLPPSEWPSRLALDGITTNNVELRVIGRDGASTPVLVSAAPILAVDGKIIGAVIVAQDITPVKELEREREEWISIVAHDLRQPITTIVGYAQLLARQAEFGAPQIRKPAEYIETSARQLNRMIVDLLDTSRIDTARLSLDKKAIDLDDFLREVTERVGEAMVEHPIRLEMAANLPPIEADPGRLEQILTNLLTNAAKYGYPDAPIRVSVERHGDMVEIAVINRGPGISADALPHLFDRFFRTHAARESRVAGLGVGLYITKGLVAAHGGQIRVASTPGEETTFAFSLPVDACAGARPFVRKPPLSMRTDPERGRSPRSSATG